ncbi:FAD-binding oxidoreductase [Liquorilactobacillus satsumensis]|uniref:FAD-binding oxidoreductase n=1 Tax=Liquorilactobacillus satsumensis TaxID=259059 RepID=UPI0039EB6B1E
MNILQLLPDTLKKIAVVPLDKKYNSVRSNCFRVGSPALVLTATNELQIKETVKFVAYLNKIENRKIPFSVRSGGHGMMMTSVNNGGIILDISQYNHVTIEDSDKGTVRIQAGAVWGDVAQVLSPYQLAISSGDFGDTGVGGPSIFGGIGLMVRKQGLTIDHIIGARLITGTGSALWVDKEHYPDIFWGIRGGGQIGIVTEFLFEAFKIPTNSRGLQTPVVSQEVMYKVKDICCFIKKWQDWVNNSTVRLTSNLMINKNSDKYCRVNAHNLWCEQKSREATDILDKSKLLGPIEEEKTQELSYAKLVKAPHILHTGQDKMYIKNGLVQNLSEDIISSIVHLLNSSEIMSIEIRSVGGKLNQKSNSFNAWSHRNVKWFIAIWGSVDNDKKINKLVNPLLNKLDGVYGGYSSDISSEENEKVWSPTTLIRLKKLQLKTDPQGIFTCRR